MPDEATRKHIALAYCERMNAGQVDRVLDLFADRVRYQEPIGAPPVIGRERLRPHIARAIEADVEEEPGRPVAALDGEHVILPVVATMSYLPIGPEMARAGLLTAPAHTTSARLRFNMISEMKIGADSLIHSVRVFWGRADITVLPAG